MRLEISNGDKEFYEGDSRNEKLVRVEHSNKDKWFRSFTWEIGSGIWAREEYSNMRNISKKNPVKKQNYKKETNTSNTKIYSIKEKRSRLKKNVLKHRRNKKKIVVALIEKPSIERLFMILIFLTFPLLAILVVYIQSKKPSTIIMTEPTIQP